MGNWIAKVELKKFLDLPADTPDEINALAISMAEAWEIQAANCPIMTKLSTAKLREARSDRSVDRWLDHAYDFGDRHRIWIG